MLQSLDQVRLANHLRCMCLIPDLEEVTVEIYNDIGQLIFQEVKVINECWSSIFSGRNRIIYRNVYGIKYMLVI